ncbi:MAG: hypothetical protein IPK83_11710 [Planctomycetes bacterium]|nr:hypothetical protein [Planctomycetota bacterium]
MTRPQIAATILIAVSLSACGCDTLEQLILRPSDNIRSSPSDFGYDAEKLALPMDDGTQISIWHCKTTSPERKGILLVVPGNDANKGRYTAGLPLFADFGWDMVLMDYPGFGESTGQKSLDGLIHSTFVVADYCFESSDVVVGYGISMGAPVLMRVAAERDFDAVMFESILDLWAEGSGIAKHFLGGLPGVTDSPLTGLIDLIAIGGSSDDWDTKRWAALVEEPKLFIHSAEDNVTPFATMWEVYKAAPYPKHIFVTEGEHALQVFLDPVLYRETVNGWLDGVLNHDPILNAEFQEILRIETQTALDELGL